MDELLRTLKAALIAQETYDKAAEEYGGNRCYHEEQAAERAKSQFEQELFRIIAERIEAERENDRRTRILDE